MITKKQNTDFGMVLTLALLVSGTIWHIHNLYITAIVTLILTAQIPIIYTPFSWVWFKFAKFTEMFFSIVVLSFIFYLIVTPLGLMRRWFAKDELQLRSFKKDKKSVFIVKNTIYKKEDLENQF